MGGKHGRKKPLSVSYYERRNNGGGLYNTYIGTITIKTEFARQFAKGERE